MDDNQQLLITDSLNNSPRNSIKTPTQQQEILLIDCDKIQLRTSDLTIQLADQIAYAFNRPNLKTETKQLLNFCFLKGQESQQQQSQCQKMYVSQIKAQQNDQTKVVSSFDYKNLTKKLQIALERIKKKIQSKVQLNFSNFPIRKTLYSSRCITRVNSPREYREKMFEYQSQLTDRKKSHSLMKTCITQPDQKESCVNIFERRRNVEKYKTDRIINEQVQKQNPSSIKTRRGQPIRTKKEFLASMANWQEKKAKRHRDLIEKEKQLLMASVTFTPEINAKSKELMKKKGQILPIYERQIHHIRHQSDQIVKKPVINKGKK